MRRFFRPVPLAVTAAVALLIYTLVGFFLIPYIIKAYVFPKVSEQLQHPVFANEVEVNPFALSLRLTGFEIQEKDQSPFIGFDELYLNIEAISLLRRTYVFDTIRFAIPYLSVKVSKDGRVNLAELIPPSDSQESPVPEKKPEKSSAVPAVEIGRFEIVQGVVQFLDESKKKPFSLDVVPINLVLENFHTKPGGENAYAFTAELGKDKTVSWEGRVSIEPIQSEGKFSFRGLSLPVLWRYVQEGFRFTIAKGTLGVDGQYRLDADVSPPNVEMDDVSVDIADVTLVEQGMLDPVVVIPSLKVDGIQLDLRARRVAIASATVADAVWTAWLNADGSVNYQSLFAPVKEEPASSPPPLPTVHTSPPAKETPWTVTLKEADIKNHSINFEDRSLRSPMQAKITGFSVHTHDVAVPFKHPIPLSMELTLNESGRMKLDGQVAVNPVSANLALGLKQIAIKPFEPYLERFALVNVDSGDIDLNGDLHLALEHPNAPMLTYRGNLGIKNLAITDREDGSALASWKQLLLKSISLAVDPTSVTIDEVGLDQPAIHASVLPDGQLNFSKVRPPADTAAPTSSSPPAPTAKKSAAATVAVNTVKLLKGSVTFTDASVQPAVRTGLYDLTGTIKGLSSKQLTKTDVAISGRVDKVAPLKISGTVNPLNENAPTDLKIDFDNVDLTPVGPYSGKYAGYLIQKGKLFLDLSYKVSKKQLEAENKVSIDQLTFGEKTNSPDATSLPVPFAVALLKDRNGKIDIDLPIRGDLNDPDFKYGKVVISTLLNILTKLVASPFALMGKLVPQGGTAEDLQFMEFLPGSSILSSENQGKAETLAKGLQERPGLRLDVVGTADSVHDREALALQKLSNELLARWNRDHGKPPGNSDPIPVEDERRLITELYESRRNKTPASETAHDNNAPRKPLTVEDMRRELVAAMPPDEEGLRALARRRAEEIRNGLTGKGKLAEERIYLVDVELTDAQNEKIRSRLAIEAAQ